VKINGLYYDIRSDGTASLTYDPTGRPNTYGSNVVIPSSFIYEGKTYYVEGIDDASFQGQDNVKTISIPKELSNVGSPWYWSLFAPQIEYIYVHPENKHYTDIDGVLYNKKKNNLLFYPPSKSAKTYVIPDGVEYLWNYCFNNNKYIVSITIPKSVVEVPYDAFNDCISLKEIKMPRGLRFYKTDYLPSTANIIFYDIDPPLLALVNGTLSFSDQTGNKIINANEKCTIKFKIQNNGKGAAQNCEARVKLSGTTSGINVKNIKLPEIAVGQTYEVNIPVTSNINTENGKVSFSIEVFEPNGWGVAPFDLSIATKAFESPLLQVVDYKMASPSGKIRKMEPFTLTFNLQNTKYGDAENVKVNIQLPTNVYVMDGSSELSYPIIKSGEVKKIQITLAANNNYSSTNLPVLIDIKEKYGKFAENKHLDIALNQAISSIVDIAAEKAEEQERKEIQLALLKSDVDQNIPQTATKNNNTFVLIIANENYSHVAAVPFALNDGNIFREYCIKTLGIGEKHIKYLSDATGNDIRTGINWLANLSEVFDNPQIIVYYAGHGFPDELSKSAYLLPIDGSGTDVATGYKLDDLYATLGNMPASQITVFMDACFSGSKREDGMLASARGVALKAKSGVPQGNMVVFSAAQGDETAYPNREQQHGMFTYYLLKKLQETEGNVDLKTLGDYVIKQVSQQSILLNSKKQTPSVTPSAAVGTDWQNWKLK
jgi:hypothetical protein